MQACRDLIRGPTFDEFMVPFIRSEPIEQDSRVLRALSLDSAFAAVSRGCHSSGTSTLN